jgi:arylsulfatase A-like enzyme
MNRINFLSLCFVALFFASCQNQPQEEVASDRPNILFVIMDDVTYLHMGAYGCDWVNTPNFDRIAKEGILFMNAYTPNAKCAPSRANILTGRNSWQLEEAANHWPQFPVKFKSFAESLDENGYHVGYTGKGWAPGKAANEDGSPRDLLVNKYGEFTLDPPTTGIANTDYAENFKAFLSDNSTDDPFFFWFGSWEPHRGYEYGSGIRVGEKSLEQIANDQVFEFWPKVDSVKTDLLDYAYEIEYFDLQLGKMLDHLDSIGELENTLIVVTADNGMPFPRVKGQEYEYSNHLPLAMRWPKGISGENRKVEDYVSFIDFAPTFLELAEVKEADSGMDSITGLSLTDILFSKNSGVINSSRDQVLIGKERHDVGRPDDQGYPIRGLVKNGMLYLYNFEPERWPAGNPETGYLNTDGGATKTVVLNSIYKPETFQFWEWNFGKRPQEELYNIAEDPNCLVNLAEDSSFEVLKNEMKTELLEKLKAQGDPRALGNGDIFDRYPYVDPKSVDFYNRYMKGEEVTFGWVNASDFQDVSKIPTYQKMLNEKENQEIEKK